MNQATPDIEKFAGRILDYERVRRGSVAETAAFRVCGKLRHPLCTLAGIAGFRALLGRALAMAKTQNSALSVVQVSQNGNLEGLDKLAAQSDRIQIERAELLLIANLLSLLVTFIGLAVTIRLAKGAWPEVKLDDLTDMDGAKREIKRKGQ